MVHRPFGGRSTGVHLLALIVRWRRRSLVTMTVLDDDPTHAAGRATVREALLDPAIAGIVDMVFSVDGPAGAPVYEAASATGSVRFTRHVEGDGWAFEVLDREGVEPLAEQATDRFSSLAEERANPYPDRSANSYPFAFEQVSQLFDSPVAPDLCVQHSAAHNWEDQGGHRGEHGSTGVVQARAPFLIAGAGVAADGMVPRACRLIDVAPTVLALAGASPAPASTGQNGRPLAGGLLARQDGRVLDDLLDPGQAHPSTSSASSGTAPTRTCSTTSPPGATPPTWPASWPWAPPTPTAPCPACRRSRSPTTRRSSRGPSRATTASCTTPGGTAPAGSR